MNYRARVERDRGAERQAAIAEAIRAFLPALDDLTRAEAHGDIQEGTPMAAVAQKLKAAGEKFGLSHLVKRARISILKSTMHWFRTQTRT